MNTEINNKQQETQIEKLRSEVAYLTKMNQSLNDTVLDQNKRLDSANEIISRLEHLYVFKDSAAQIAHEINNPVNFVLSSVEVIRRNVGYFKTLMRLYKNIEGLQEHSSYKEIEEMEEFIDVHRTNNEFDSALNIMRNGFQRVQEIVINLGLLGRGDQLPKVETYLNENIISIISLMEGKTKGKIQIVTDLKDIPTIKAENGIFNHVFINTFKNAIESIFEKPKLKNEFLYIQTALLEDDKIEIRIQDSGMGMTDETKERLFEKFYTTKDPGRGTGLGMDVTKRVIESYHGRIEVDSEWGKGTEVIITLPIHIQKIF